MSIQEKSIYGLVGHPVTHSLSPLMHNAAFAHLKMNAEYKLFDLSPEEVKSFLSTLHEKNISGLNVTIPYKERVFSLLTSVSTEARLIGAVNTIKVEGIKIEGFNTDGDGFLRHLSEGLKFSPEAKTVALIGAGGAARAVSVSLGKAKAKSVSIYDVDQKKCEALILHLAANFPNTKFLQAGSINELNISNSNLLVNATPVGMKESEPCLVEEGVAHKDLLVYDLVYVPQETKLLQCAKKNGARISNGLGMLLYQGMIAFEIWTGLPAPKKIMQDALKKGVNKL